MDHFEQRFHQLLSQLLDGELSPEESAELEHLCESRPERVAVMRRELELAELMRQAAVNFAEEEAPAAPFPHRMETVLGDPPARDLDELINELVEGEISESGIDEIVHHCWRDESSAQVVRRALMDDDLMQQALAPGRCGESFVESLATRMWAEQEEDHFVEEVATKIVKLHPELPDTPIREEKSRRRRREHTTIGFLGGWAAAAAAVVGLIAAVLFEPGGSGSMTSVAELTKAAGNVAWGVGDSPLESQYFVPGRYQLESGVVTLTFASGAEMTIEGPADFEVWNEREAFVHTGVTVLAKNSAVDTFRLRSPTLDFGETGDTIGLIADGSSSAEAVVFDGGAEICLTDSGQCRSLFPLEPVRADRDRDKLVDIPYNPTVFARAWEVNAGVERNSGPVRLAMPGHHPGFGNDPEGEVQIFVEKSRFVADRDIEVDTLDPGHFAAITAGGSRQLASGNRELRSYLLQLVPNESDADALEASVTFDHEIVGIIYSPDKLAESDSVVGSGISDGEMLAMQGRGLDSGDGASGDEILLSDDRRTVNLKLRGGAEDRLDHVRVLVALN